MKKTTLIICTILIATSLLSACRRTDVGMVGGGVLGGVAGSALTNGSPVGAVVGAVGGAYVGHELAR
jgi:osmotically inducible lipoprotein OsmB